mmetsp:Transcript_4190/g.7418  ORF Transcript_4190/g.7418 Transcript_4190/m.7418 type:complete len:283 (-) Transcript_4190:1115-1963(-)
MEIEGGVREPLELMLNTLLALPGFNEILLALCFLFFLVSHCLALGGDIRSGVLSEGLVVRLALTLSVCGLSFHLLGIGNELLEHEHDAVASFALLVVAECLRLLGVHLWFLQERLLFVVELTEDGESLLQQLLGASLLLDHALELGVLLLAILCCDLLLLLQLLDVRCQLLDGILGISQLRLQLLQLCCQVLVLSGLLLCGHPVLVELLVAVLLFGSLVGLLLRQGLNHEVDLLLHAREGIQLGLHGKSSQSGILHASLGEYRSSTCATSRLVLGDFCDLQE